MRNGVLIRNNEFLLMSLNDNAIYMMLVSFRSQFVVWSQFDCMSACNYISLWAVHRLHPCGSSRTS